MGKNLLFFMSIIFLGFICVFFVGCKTECEHNYILKSILLERTDVLNAGLYECSVCHNETQDTIQVSDINIPILSFCGDISGMSKENKVLVSVAYDDGIKKIDCGATLKWQGASSLVYPKKNYTMQLLESGSDKKKKVELNSDWGKQSKYCLKANYIDYSQARNVVSGQIYRDIVHTRDFNEEIESLKNGGVVDGFPVVIFINSKYQGLYTLNIPKDKWMFGMDDDNEDDDIITKQALLMGDTWTDSTKLKEEISDDYISSGFELEYCSTEDTIGDDWVVESFNNMIDFINTSNGKDFIEGIENYISLERTIDSMIYTLFIMATDNTSKNILWVTYDGFHWFSSMYDMDSTWGLSWDGSIGTSAETTWLGYLTGNNLWKKIFENFSEKVIERYFQLRETILLEENLINKFTQFDNKIPGIIREAEKEKWYEVPSIETNNLEQIIDFIYKRCETLDELMLVI